MNKQQLIDKGMAAVKSPMTHADAERFTNAILDAIKASVAEGEPVQLVGFGTFEARNRAARQGRNPQTGETISIPATRVPAFSAGKAFKEQVK